MVKSVVNICGKNCGEIEKLLDWKKNTRLGFFQIVFGSKNVAKQSCRSMIFQKGGHLGFFQIDY